MRRYFIETPIDNARIYGEDARHIERVMRMKQGDKIVVVAQNTAYICTIEAFEENEVVIQATDQTIPSPELPIQVTVACGLPKGISLSLLHKRQQSLVCLLYYHLRLNVQL